MVDEVTSSGTGTDVVPGRQVQWADWLEGRHQTPKECLSGHSDNLDFNSPSKL